MRRAIGLAVMLLLPVAVSVEAAPDGTHWQFTPVVGYAWFDDARLVPLPRDARSVDQLAFGARLGVLRDAFGIELSAGLIPGAAREAGEEDADLSAVSAALEWLPWRQRRADVFVVAGGGAARLSGSIDRTFGTLDLGLGSRLWLSDVIALRAELREVFASDAADHLVASGGLTFALGGTPRDSDRDGVRDQRDACPDTPAGARVDAAGCPRDSDQDRVFDGLDQCEGTPRGAVVDAVGCPLDADGDGVFDGLDACPGTPSGAVVDMRGCPGDSDGDGVFDGLDACEATPRGALVDARGCPSDADGDSVFDGLDQCPNTPALLRVDEHGCPIEVIERESEFLDTGLIRLQGIQFETGRAEILDSSTPDLEVVAMILEKWPELRIEVGGHTDARGAATDNLRLSRARAEAVVGWLVTRHSTLKAEQFTAHGYGEGRPIATNATAAGRGKNRRVEFVVTNRDVLRREIERRRLAPRDR